MKYILLFASIALCSPKVSADCEKAKQLMSKKADTNAQISRVIDIAKAQGREKEVYGLRIHFNTTFLNLENAIKENNKEHCELYTEEVRKLFTKINPFLRPQR